MDLNSPNSYQPTQAVSQVQVDEGLRQYMLRVYNYMASGLVVSGLTAWLLMTVPQAQALFFKTVETAQGALVLRPTLLGIIGMLAPLGIIFFGSLRGHKMAVGTIQLLYWVFVALQGIGLSLVFQAYTGESVVRVLFVTAASFAGLSLYGYSTRRNLTGVGSFMTMGLFGLIIAMLVNIFWPAPALNMAISVIGVIVFAGLTAYDTQKIKEQYAATHGRDVLTKSAVWSALDLYLDFLNLFLFLLRLMGNRK